MPEYDQPTPAALPELVYAQASPRSIGGRSLFDAPLVTAKNVTEFFSEEAVTAAAVARLEAEGFEVLQVTPATINIAAPAELYERVFGTKLVAEERTLDFGDSSQTKTFVVPESSTIPGLLDTSSSPLADVLEGVAIEEPVTYFANAFPPPAKYWHLDVPADVSLGVNADHAHRGGTTGRGVKVVMVDTGWYRHPFFTARGYRASNVVLAPGAANPLADESGHGTGESANIFAAAPDVDFTMVKQSPTNATASFNAAVALHPDIITCSWGWSVQNGPLSAAQQTLAAAIAMAVANGITVVFSAGNGHWGFPGQHPDVISAGGVYMTANGAVTASNYASGFASNIYAGRKVPDVSGLVGMLPKAIYIMLPVQDGDDIDSGNGGGVHPNGDETVANDGWAAFSGTSAAAPQIAGVCALLKQACPKLKPAGIRSILQKTAKDVVTGTSAQGNVATVGADLATGSGLVDAQKAVLLAKIQCPGVVIGVAPKQPIDIGVPTPVMPIVKPIVVGPKIPIIPLPIDPGPIKPVLVPQGLSDEDIVALEALIVGGNGSDA